MGAASMTPKDNIKLSPKEAQDRKLSNKALTPERLTDLDCLYLAMQVLERQGGPTRSMWEDRARELLQQAGYRLT